MIFYGQYPIIFPLFIGFQHVSNHPLNWCFFLDFAGPSTGETQNPSDLKETLKAYGVSKTSYDAVVEARKSGGHPGWNILMVIPRRIGIFNGENEGK